MLAVLRSSHPLRCAPWLGGMPVGTGSRFIDRTGKLSLDVTDLNRASPPPQPVMHFYSGLPKQFLSGVDTHLRPRSTPSNRILDFIHSEPGLRARQGGFVAINCGVAITGSTRSVAGISRFFLPATWTARNDRGPLEVRSGPCKRGGERRVAAGRSYPITRPI